MGPAVSQARKPEHARHASRKSGQCLTFLRQHAVLLAAIAGVTALTWPLTGTSCIFRATCGLPCPGCGLTRSVLAILHGDWQLSLRMHPLTGLLAIYALYFLLKHALQRMKQPFGLASAVERKAMIGLIIALLAVYAIRMILFFPDQAPMTWNPDSIVGQLLRLGEHISLAVRRALSQR